MIALARRWSWPAVLAFIGAVLAVFFVPALLLAWEYLNGAIDAQMPPATATVHRLERISASTVEMQVWIQRRRDCVFVRATAFTGNTLNDMRSAYAARADGHEPVNYPVGIRALSVPWRITPINGPRVLMYSYYDCADRLVKVKLLDAVISP